MKKRVIAAGIVVLLIIWTGNIAYYYSQKLKEPVFLKHYYSLYIDNGYILNFHYLMNNGDNDEVYGIELPGLGVVYTSQAGGYNRVEEYSHHTLKTISIRIDENMMNNAVFPIDFKKIKLMLSTGGERTVDIGEIHLDRYPRETGPLQNLSSGSSNSNAGFCVFKASDDATIMGVDTRYKEIFDCKADIMLDVDQSRLNSISPEDHSGMFELSGRKLEDSVFPIKLGAGERIKTAYIFNFEKEDAGRFNIYKMQLPLKVSDKAGKLYTNLFEMHYDAYFNEADIHRIVRLRGEKK